MLIYDYIKRIYITLGESMLVLYLTYFDEEKDKKKFEELYYAYRKQMTMVALAIVHHQSEAEDIVHEVFLNIAIRYMNTINRINDETDLRNYLLKATKNTALNWVNKHKRILYREKEALESQTSSIDDDVFLEYICQQMEYKRVLLATQKLETKYRDVIYYHYILEIPVSQVASMLNQSISATKKQLVRGKKKLLKILEEEGM